jgi:hypothetical protein
MSDFETFASEGIGELSEDTPMLASSRSLIKQAELKKVEQDPFHSFFVFFLTLMSLCGIGVGLYYSIGVFAIFMISYCVLSSVLLLKVYSEYKIDSFVTFSKCFKLRYIPYYVSMFSLGMFCLHAVIGIIDGICYYFDITNILSSFMNETLHIKINYLNRIIFYKTQSNIDHPIEHMALTFLVFAPSYSTLYMGLEYFECKLVKKALFMPKLYNAGIAGFGIGLLDAVYNFSIILLST